MSTNNFLITGKGFFKNMTFDHDAKKNKFEWTEDLREAKGFKSKRAAAEFAKKFNIRSFFVWNPYKKVPTGSKWKVVRRTKYTSILDDSDHQVLDWFPQKVIMESLSDLNFLKHRDRTVEPEPTYDTYEEAAEAARLKNEAAIEELKRKNEKLISQ